MISPSESFYKVYNISTAALVVGESLLPIICPVGGGKGEELVNFAGLLFAKQGAMEVAESLLQAN